MRKNLDNIAFVSMLISSTILCLWLSTELKQKNTLIENLNGQIANLKQMKYSDSLLVSQYQESMIEFLHKNPKAAIEFANFMEKTTQ